ncbi:hypothetical protein IL59_0215235 [Brucella suis bv. 4 str. 40]|nr:hypothetical protein IL59_0215235 [Brucella suis bv. 4 str. 40]
MLEIERLAGLGEFLGDIAGPVVSHHPRDGDAKACIVGDGSFEKGYGADGFFIRKYVGEGDAGSIIDADMDIFPANPARVGLSGILFLRRLSLDYKTLAENDSELSFCLEPFTRRPFPVASCLIEHEI